MDVNPFFIFQTSVPIVSAIIQVRIQETKKQRLHLRRAASLLSPSSSRKRQKEDRGWVGALPLVAAEAESQNRNSEAFPC